MASLPADRTKLALAQSNQVPNMVIASAKNINAVVEVYDTVDLLNQKVDLNYGTGAIGTNQLATDSVTLAKMADNSVGTSELVAASVTLAKMAAASVGTSQLVDGSVTRAKIANSSVGSSQLDPILLTDFGDIAVQAEFDRRGIDVMKYGAKGDGVTDDTAAINAALNSGNTDIFLPQGKIFLISDTLTVPDYVNLFSIGGLAFIHMTTINKPALSIGAACVIESIKINLPSGNTLDTGCGIQPRLTNTGTDTYFVLNDVYIQCGDLSANGIYITGSVGTISFARISGLKLNGLKNGIKTNTSGTSYANGFVMNNIVCNTTTRLFHFTGTSGGGHTVDGLIWNQTGSTTEVIWCDSSDGNNIRGYFYDLGLYGSTTILLKATGASQYNIVYGALDLNDTNVSDTTTNKLNFINIDKRKFSGVLNQFINLPYGYMDFTDIDVIGYWSKTKPYGGWTENILAYSDKVHTVTTTPAPTNSIGGAFDPMAQQANLKPFWAPTGTNTAVIEIDFNLTLLSTTNKRMDYFSIFFAPTNYPQGIIVDVWNRTTAAWSTIFTTTTNSLRYVEVTGARDGKSFATDVQKIRVTMSLPILGSGGAITVEQIHARLLSNMGLAFLPRGGGQIFGNLDMNGNYLTVGKVAALPTASATYRGQRIRVEGAAGVADVTYECMKSAADTYSWKVIMTG